MFVLFRAIRKGAEPNNESRKVYNEVETSNCKANNFYDVTQDLEPFDVGCHDDKHVCSLKGGHDSVEVVGTNVSPWKLAPISFV